MPEVWGVLAATVVVILLVMLYARSMKAQGESDAREEQSKEVFDAVQRREEQRAVGRITDDADGLRRAAARAGGSESVSKDEP